MCKCKCVSGRNGGRNRGLEGGEGGEGGAAER